MKKIEVEFDEAKRIKTMEERGLDFRDCAKVLQAPHLQFEDNRKDYGEPRFQVFGWLDERRIVLTWTPRGMKHRIISMRHAHEEEFTTFKGILD